MLCKLYFNKSVYKTGVGRTLSNTLLHILNCVSCDCITSLRSENKTKPYREECSNKGLMALVSSTGVKC